MVNVLDLSDIEFGSNRLASALDTTVHGTFYHTYLAVHYAEDTYNLSRPDQIRKRLRRERDPAKRLLTAIRQVTLLHEVRHFHDCFGTNAGITLFLHHLARLRAFLGMCSRLNKDNLILKLPLAEWVEDSSCPKYVQEFFFDFIRHAIRQ